MGVKGLDQQQIYKSIIDNLRDGVYVVDTERKLLFWNRAAQEITGYAPEEVVGRHCQETGLNHINETGLPLCQVGCPLFATLADGQQRKDRVFVRHKEGYRVPIQVNIFPVWQEGEITGAVEIFTRDSPAVYEGDLVEQLSNIAMHDALTKLPNRRYLESFLRYKWEEYQRFGCSFAVLFADVDHFSRVNNVYGHEAGDAVLRNIAASIRRSVRRNDLVGRWGGEEFVGIYAGAEAGDEEILGEKFRQLIQNTDVPCGRELLRVTVSVGVTVIRREDTAERVVERADALMYESKKQGKNRVTIG